LSLQRGVRIIAMKKYIFKRKRNIIIVSLIDFVGNVFFSVPKRECIFSKKEKNKILITQIAPLGDVVCSIPFFNQLKENLPDSKIYVLTTPEGGEILKYNNYIDGVFTFRAPWARNKRLNLAEFFLLRKRIKKEHFSYAIELKGDFRNILLLKFCGVRKIIGYGVTGGDFLLTKRLDWNNNLHTTERMLKILGEIGLSYHLEKPIIFHSNFEEESAWAKSILNTKKPIVAYHLYAGTEAKKWPQEYFIRLIRKVSETFDVKTVLIGKDKIEKIMLENIDYISLIGKTSVRQLIHILLNATLLVTNESGPAHIASAIGTPAVVIWGGTSNPRLWKPMGENIEIVHKDVECQFCERKVCPSMTCLRKIEVDEVFSAVKKILDKKSEDA
jgi:lipopolysaccharide heptosyltransferase II